MRWKSFVVAALALSIGVISASLVAQQTWKPLPVTKQDYVKTFPPLRIVGNLYYVGTYDLGCYLIVTPEGNILINTGINDSTAPIRANIEKLGFKFQDIKLLLATHGHWDHVGGDGGDQAPDRGEVLDRRSTKCRWSRAAAAWTTVFPRAAARCTSRSRSTVN